MFRVIFTLLIAVTLCFACDRKIECPGQASGDFTQTIQARYEVAHPGGLLNVKLYCGQPSITIHHRCNQPPRVLAQGQHEVRTRLPADIYRIELRGLGQYRVSVTCNHVQYQHQRIH